MAEEHMESPARAARRLLRALDRATLATSLDGWPYASLVLAAVDQDATPLLLLSDLAEHTRNITRDPRAALLFDGTAGRDDPLTGPRVTVLGKLVRCDEPRLLARHVARHPSASLYAGFKDFHLYRLAVARAHLVAGFGRIDWIGGDELIAPADEAEPLAAAEAEIVAHMNGVHADAVAGCANLLLGLPGDGWRLTGIDPEGVDLRRDGAVARLDFAEPVRNPAEARAELARLAKAARGNP